MLGVGYLVMGIRYLVWVLNKYFSIKFSFREMQSSQRFSRGINRVLNQLNFSVITWYLIVLI